MKAFRYIVPLVLITIINGAVFYYRDLFQYRSYASYAALYGTCTKECLQRWRPPPVTYPPEELMQAARLLSDAGIKEGATQQSVVVFIGRWLHHQFGRRASGPSGGPVSKTPLAEYNKLVANKKEQLWCGTYAGLFSFFCWSKGIPCRTVELFKPGDHHVVTECYIAELNNWILVDVTTNMLLVAKTNGELLNLQTFRTAIQMGQPIRIAAEQDNDITQKQLAKDLPFIENYYSTPYPCNYYYSTDPHYIYSFKNKLIRYIVPVSWYQVYSEKRGGNGLFFTRISFLIIWIVLLYLTLTDHLKKKRQTQKKSEDDRSKRSTQGF